MLSGIAAQSRVAERTVIGALSVRVTRGPGLRAAELSWVGEGPRDQLADSAWKGH
jgi:hypothetical protein